MATADGFNRAAALKEFDEAKTGVRGIVESGATSLPAIFRHPVARPRHSPSSAFPLSVPTIDLSLPRPTAIALAAAAARDWGFFQVVNHGIPLPFIDQTLSAVRAFHEQPPSVRSAFYSRSIVGGVSYSSNVDLYTSSAASWRDTIQILMGPTRPDPAMIPPMCREELLKWDEHVRDMGQALMGLLSEGLGSDAGLLQEATCLEGRVMVCHYYPPCPEPEMTVGTAEHTDPGVITVLVQDSVGGLQVKWTPEDGEGVWVDVQPVPGALVINVGDLLQGRSAMRMHWRARIRSTAMRTQERKFFTLEVADPLFSAPKWNVDDAEKLTNSVSRRLMPAQRCRSGGKLRRRVKGEKRFSVVLKIVNPGSGYQG